MKVGFLLLKVAEVESQPDHACINRRYSTIQSNLHCASSILLFSLIKDISLRSSFQ